MTIIGWVMLVLGSALIGFGLGPKPLGTTLGVIGVFLVSYGSFTIGKIFGG